MVALILLAYSVSAAVDLLYFEAENGSGFVLLKWETASELNHAGFYVNRSEVINGVYKRISPFIPARGDGNTGAYYEYQDRGVVLWETYYYKLEIIDNSGSSNFTEPVTITFGVSTPTQTMTFTRTATVTRTGTITHVNTQTSTPVGGATVTATPSATGTQSQGPTITKTNTRQPTSPPSATRTNFPEFTFTPTSLITLTPFPAYTEWPTITQTLIPLPEFTLIFPSASPSESFSRDKPLTFTPVVSEQIRESRISWLDGRASFVIGLIVFMWAILALGIIYIFRRPGS